MIRIFDFLIALFGIIILMPLILVIFLILYFDNKSPFFFQERIGKNLKKFTLIKFRTMSKSTKECATHLVDTSKITTLGSFLRKTKLDEIPQLLNVLKGEMSFVGPRPCLPIQTELMKLRQELNIHFFLPGITGLAQVKGIDMSNPLLLAKTEYEMIKNFNIVSYFSLIFATLIGNGFGDRVKKK
tara:strand:+ start:87 stop:641 length:555 start_codon:yes stop_codon:yes gene_type:complete